MTRRRQTLAEEIANSVTHAVGVGLAIAALVVLTVFAARRGDPWRIVGFSIYGSTLVLVYLASTLYHAFHGPRVKRLLRELDHVAIYLLIAGTYTPVTLVGIRGAWGWTLFGVIWGLALVGIAAKFTIARRVRGLATTLYLAMGWMVVVALRPLIEALPAGLILWLLAGGIFYSLGVVFWLMHRLPFHHAIWHLLVLAGSACHFVGMLLYLAPPPDSG